MAYLEERVDGEALVEFGAQAREGLVGKEDISLNFLGYLVDSSGVAEAKGFSSRLERTDCVKDGVQEAVALQWRQRWWQRLRCGYNVDGHCRLF